MTHDGNVRAPILTRPRLKLWAGNVRRAVYENLRSDEFRLLDIRGHEKDGGSTRLECWLRRERLSDLSPGLEYTSVSYTWTDHTAHWTTSDEPSSRDVLVNGHIIPVGRRLEPMLRALRDFKYTTVWIDAICIDQDDPAERAAQVAKMREIYSKANKTIIFLGLPTTHSDCFFEYLREKKSAGMHVGSEAMPPEPMNGVLEIFQNPYWKRAWIVQEIAVSRRVELICGNQSCTWESFIAMSFRWDVRSMVEGYTFGNFTVDQEIRAIDTFRRERQKPLLTVLSMTRASMATLSLDTVYAKLGLAFDAEELVPKLTYGTKPARLFAGLAKAYIERRNDLYIICVTRETKSPDIQVPSWAPDWSQSTERRSLLRFFYTGWMKMTHVRHPKMHVKSSRGVSELHVRGAIIDEIGSFSSTESHGLEQDAVVVFPAICRAAVPDHFILPRLNSESSTAVGFMDQFAMHACLFETQGDAASRYISSHEDIPPEKRPRRPLRRLDDFDGNAMTKDTKVEAAERFQKWYENVRETRIGSRTVADWASLYLRARYSPDGSFPRLNIDKTGGLEVSLAVMSWYRRLTGTVSGRPALVPEQAVVGDFICLLYGCPVPVVLRRTSRKYILLGECYVDGLMDEQLVDGRSETPRDEVMFKIR